MVAGQCPTTATSVSSVESIKNLIVSLGKGSFDYQCSSLNSTLNSYAQQLNSTLNQIKANNKTFKYPNVTSEVQPKTLEAVNSVVNQTEKLIEFLKDNPAKELCGSPNDFDTAMKEFSDSMDNLVNCIKGTTDCACLAKVGVNGLTLLLKYLNFLFKMMGVGTTVSTSLSQSMSNVSKTVSAVQTSLNGLNSKLSAGSSSSPQAPAEEIVAKYSPSGTEKFQQKVADVKSAVQSAVTNANSALKKAIQSAKSSMPSPVPFVDALKACGSTCQGKT